MPMIPTLPRPYIKASTPKARTLGPIPLQLPSFCTTFGSIYFQDEGRYMAHPLQSDMFNIVMQCAR